MGFKPDSLNVRGEDLPRVRPAFRLACLRSPEPLPQGFDRHYFKGLVQEEPVSGTPANLASRRSGFRRQRERKREREGEREKVRERERERERERKGERGRERKSARERERKRK